MLDEPSTGLHVHDIEILICVLDRLIAQDSTIIIDHDPDLIANSDYDIDLGPGDGPSGGRIVAASWQLAGNPESLTGRYLSGRGRI
ncbi:hypothetical protein [Sporolactobacillus pectinivorans]|uniref:hypothetical protein n=1 Tax=Sporolactobacillus pectinivorans TaxID=1591408 RepID=UPI000C26C10B|nr:hypothetical protein [Sporolactobacillus pectinivorans]